MKLQFNPSTYARGKPRIAVEELERAAATEDWRCKCRKFGTMVWGGSSSTGGKNSRQATLSSLLVFFFVLYFTTALLWRPTLPASVFEANEATRTEPILRQFEKQIWSEYKREYKQPQPPKFSAQVKKLLRDLQAATRAAESGGGPFSYTEEEQTRWRRGNPCRARSELPFLYAQRDSTTMERNRQWEAVLEEYWTLHRTCTQRIANLTDYFLKGSTEPGCKFVTGESLFGLGNQITYAASVVLYGILTQRVVLFYEWSSWVPAVMCEPFEGSSWRLPYALHYLNERKLTPLNVNEQVATNSTQRFLDWVDREKAPSRKIQVSEHQPQIYHAEVDDGWQPVDRFFCDSEQEFLSQVRWVSMAGCLYFMPKLFAVTSFRPTLEALFPDRMALTHLLRTVFLPYNVAWDRIQRQNDLFLSQAEKRVGIQVRYRLSHEYSQLHHSVNRKTIRCLLENGILPNVSDDAVHNAKNLKYAVRDSAKPSTTKVLITSLQSDLYDLLQDTYLRSPTVTGESVGIVQLSHESDQHWGFEPGTEALVEMILLSLADELLVTPLSTFGGVAQAYGGLKPWIVDHSTSTSGSCIQASSVDICYQQANDTFSCPHDPDVHNRKVSEHVPFLQKCLEIDSPSGLVLITS